MILAEKGNLIGARELLLHVREAADIADVCVNLAHVYLLQGQHVNAVKMYENTLLKFYDNKVCLMLLFFSVFTISCYFYFYFYFYFSPCMCLLLVIVYLFTNFLPAYI